MSLHRLLVLLSVLLVPPAWGQTFTEFLRATNRAWLPEATFHALQATPDGRPAFIAFSGPQDGPCQLLYWERGTDGQWRKEVVVDTLEPMRASLFLDPWGSPAVLVGDEVHVRTAGVWSFLQVYAADTWYPEAVAVDPTVRFKRLALAAPDSAAVPLDFSTFEPFDRTGWQDEPLSIYAAGMSAFDSSAQPRFFSAVCDALGNTHAVYVPEFYSASVEGGAIVRSELWYLTNRRGYWESHRLYAPPVGGYGDAGLGACIALRPDGLPSVASVFVSRTATGSATAARLLLHEMAANDTWATSQIATSADGYQAGDGNLGTGYAPHLLYDGQGRPHIAFTDFAGQHFDGFGQDEFGGNLRHAWRDGATWHFTTVLRQTDPIRNQFLWPNLTFLSNGRLGVFGQVRQDVLDSDFNITTNLHSLAYVEFTPAGYSVACAYALGSNSTNHSSIGESGSFPVTTGGGCGWTAVSSAAWLHTSSAGSGLGWVSYSVDENPGATFRTATINVAGQNFTVTQGAAGWVWDDLFGWLYFGGSGWYGGSAYGWMWFSGGEWIWSTELHGWLAVMQTGSRKLWSTQFRWFTLSSTDAYRAQTSTLGDIYVGQYHGAPITDGWVVSDRFGYVWAAGDGTWFYSDRFGWLGVTPDGGIWSVTQGKFL